MKAGMELLLAGPIPDGGYFEEHVRPWLGQRVRYIGHLTADELAHVVGRASVSVVTPVWEEPFGLIVAESMACGTPVAGFARGALPELIGASGGVVVPPGDVDGLASAMATAQDMDRSLVRAHAATTCSIETMLRGYEQLYAELALRPAA
jgi:glycosyltransferase involved in cell wall biosynthesis